MWASDIVFVFCQEHEHHVAPAFSKQFNCKNRLWSYDHMALYKCVYYYYYYYYYCRLLADISYVTFSKASEAALAIEEMNGKCMFDNPRPLKVIDTINSLVNCNTVNCYASLFFFYHSGLINYAGFMLVFCCKNMSIMSHLHSVSNLIVKETRLHYQFIIWTSAEAINQYIWTVVMLERCYPLIRLQIHKTLSACGLNVGCR